MENDKDWYENVCRKAFGIDQENFDISEQEKKLLEGKRKFRDLAWKKEKQRLQKIQKSVIEDAAKKVNADIEVVPKGDKPDEEVKKASKEANKWLEDNPEIKKELEEKVDDATEKFFDSIELDK